ncbi:M23 family metallopeptidase [Acidisoma sp. 7E03]
MRGATIRLAPWLAALCLPALVAAAPPARPPVPSAIGPLLRPVTPGCVTSPFGPRFLPQAPVSGHYHWGVDLRAAAGAQVRAVAVGQIIRIDRKGMGGLEILVQHKGFRALYAHLGMVAPRIANGARTLHAGDWIGRIGRTGLTLGTHLYFEIAIDGKRVDPVPYLGVTACGAGKSAEVRPISQ